MNDDDVTTVLERLVEPLEDEVGSWDDVLRRAAESPSAEWVVALDGAERARDPRLALDHSRARGGRRLHTRRVLVLAAAALVVVGASAAFATARSLIFGSAQTVSGDPRGRPTVGGSPLCDTTSMAADTSAVSSTS